jgi:hypothetical protein
MPLIDIPSAIKETNKILSGQSTGQAIFSLLLTTVFLSAVIFYALQLDLNQKYFFSDVPLVSFSSSARENFALELVSIFFLSLLLNLVLWKLNFGAPAFDPKTDAYSPIRSQLIKSQHWDLTFFGFFANKQDKTGRVRMIVNDSYKKLEINLEMWDNIEFNGDGRDVSLKLDNGKLSILFLIDATAKNLAQLKDVSTAPRLKYLVHVIESSSPKEGKVLFTGDWYRLPETEGDSGFASHGRCELESI